MSASLVLSLKKLLTKSSVIATAVVSNETSSVQTIFDRQNFVK